MMIKGKDLTAKQREQVKAAFVHRNTIENKPKWARRDTAWCIPATETDDQWIKARAFYFIKDRSRLSLKHKYTKSEFLGE